MKRVFTLFFSLFFGAFNFLIAQYDAPQNLYQYANHIDSVEQITFDKYFSVADMNNNGFNDLMFSEYSSTKGSKNLKLFKGDGYSNFYDLSTIVELDYVFTNEYFITDLNNDDIQDVVFSYIILATSEIGIAWFYGNGDGTFNPTPNTIPMPENIAYFEVVDVGDFDNDENVDLLLFYADETNNETTVNVSVMFNNGAGSFGDNTILTNNPLLAFFSNNDYKTGDINGDGKLDVIVSNYYYSLNGVLPIINQGNRNFSSGLPFIQNFSDPELSNFDFATIDIADLNGDGKDEIFYTTQASSFCIGWHCTTIYEKKFAILRYNQNLNNLQVVSQALSWPHDYDEYYNDKLRLEYKDVNNDGNIDILTVFNSQILWLIGDGLGNFTIGNALANVNDLNAYNPPSIKAVDMDLDNDLDVFVVTLEEDYGSTNYVWYIENLTNQPDHDQDGFIVDEDCDDTNNQIGDTLIIEGLDTYYSVCEQDDFQFLINNASAFLEYSWTGPNSFTSQDAAPILENVNTSDSGFYNVQSSNANCESEVFQTELIVSEMPEVTIEENGTILTAVSDDADAYQWYHNGNLINGANSASYTVEASGNYYVIVNSEFGCEAISETVSIVVSGLYNQDNLSFNIFPNPVKANSNLKINFNQQLNLPADLKVFDATGKLMLQTKLQEVNNTILLDGLESGAYFIQLIDSNQKIGHKRLVIH